MDKKAILNSIDETVSGLHVKLFGERPGLSAFLFHSIFKNEQEIQRHHVLPQERMTVALFRRFLDYFLEHQYTFVTPAQIAQGMCDPEKKYGLITFDDGYFNNTLITEVLSEYKVPAVFFISTAYITEGRKFWSDAIYHERKKKGGDDAHILQEIMGLKHLKVRQIETYIVNTFGNDSLQPLSDIDRPMTAAELAEFARHPYVHLGNHTHRHEILTNLSRTEMAEEFTTSQSLLEKITGMVPNFISYPNGSFNDDVLTVAMQQGFTMGITTVQQKNRLPLHAVGQGQILLDRFNPVAANGRLDCRKFRSSVQLKTRLKKWLQ